MFSPGTEPSAGPTMRPTTRSSRRPAGQEPRRPFWISSRSRTPGDPTRAGPIRATSRAHRPRQRGGVRARGSRAGRLRASHRSAGLAGGRERLMTLVIEALRQSPVAARRVELVERKGLGYPDTNCDSLVEAIAIALNRLYRERTGTVLHYNIDKALLVAGQCVKGFGWGELKRPMTLFVGDRATFEADARRCSRSTCISWRASAGRSIGRGPGCR